MLSWLSNIPVADYVYMILLLTATVLLVVRYRHLPSNIHWLIGLTVTHLLVELMADYILFMRHGNNMYIYHLLAVVEYVIISLFFYRTFTSSLLRKRVQISIFLYIILVGLFTWKWEPLTEDNPLSFTVECAFVLFWCFSFLRETLTRDSNYQPENDPTFWVVVGLLFYFSGNFLILGGIDYFDKTIPDLAKKIYFAGYAFNYLLYLTISIICIVRFPKVAYD